MAERNERAADGRRHETSDARIGGILWVGVALVLVIVIGQVAVWGLFRAVSWDTGAPVRPPPPVPTLTPPEPRLQTSPEENLKRLRAREERILGSYGWVDPEAGVVRIPIDRAMQLLVERSRTKPSLPAGQPGEVPP